MGSELLGEDLPEGLLATPSSRQRKRGRPSEIVPQKLRRDVIELQFALEQNWGEVGWLLWQAETIADVRTAYKLIMNPLCRLLEPFTNDQVRETTSTELRLLRKRVAESTERYRRRFAEQQRAHKLCEDAFRAWVVESDPAKRGQIQAIRPSLERDYEEAETLEERSRLERESLEDELKEREAYFAQSEILKFLRSNRRRFTPLNVARALAGPPFVTWRVSCNLCREHRIDPPPGMEFEIFQTIERVLRTQSYDLSRLTDSLREHLLEGSENRLSHTAQLRDNWYFLELAVLSVAMEPRAPSDSAPYRISAEYKRRFTIQQPGDSVLAEAKKLILKDEQTGSESIPRY